MKWFIDQFERITAAPGDFAQVWNLVGVFDGVVVTHDPFSVTAVAYFPLGYMKASHLWERQMEILMRSFTSVPHGAYLNSYLLKFFEEPHITPTGTSSYDLLDFLERKRIEKLNSMKVPSYLPFIAITIPVEVKDARRDNPVLMWLAKRKFLSGIQQFKDAGSMDALNSLLTDSVHAKAFRDAIATLQSLFEQIRVKFSGGCQRLDSDQLTAFLSAMLNHTEQRPVMGLPSLFAGDAFADPAAGVVEYGGMYHATVSARTKDLPREINGTFPWLYFEESLRDVPFNIQSTIRFPASDEARNHAQLVINRIDTASSLFAPFKKMYEHQRNQMQIAMDALIECNGRIVDMGYTITTWAPSIDQLETNLTALRNVLRGREMGLSRDTYNLKTAWHGQVPWVSHRNRITTRITSMNAEAMLPTLYPPVYPREVGGYRLKEPVWFHTRFDQLTAIEPFDRNCSVWNGVIVGQSGTGKSFLANYQLMCAAQHGSKVFIIDKGGEGGGSFRNFVKNLGGTYVELNFKSSQTFAVNPFDGPLFWSFVEGEPDDDGAVTEIAVPDVKGKPDAAKIALLLSVLTLMICEREDQRLEKDQEEFLQALVEQAYIDCANNPDNDLTISIFANNYLKALMEDPKPVRSIRMDDVNLWSVDFYNKMSKYINNGIYAGYFAKTMKLESDDVFCFDLEGIDEHPDLKGILTAIVVNFCYSMAMDGNPGRKKLILIDEAWALLRGGRMTSVIESIWRTIRKHGGRIYCATQDFESIFASPAGLAIMNNSTYFYMLGSKYEWETLQKVKATGKNGVNSLTQWDYERISTHQFVKGQYSEFWFLNPVFSGTLRYRASAYDYQLATTDPEDKAKQNALKRKYGVAYVTPQIIEELVRKPGT